jgi:peptide/nickel transport system substrate-binding protein
VRLLPDAGQLLAAIKNREVDFADLISPSLDDVVQARAVPGLTTLAYEQARYERLYFNFANEYLAIPEVRRAIALALDRPGILARVGGGQLDPGKAKLTNNRLYTPGEPEYRDTSGGRYDRSNPGAARQLLEANGFQRDADGIYERAGKRLSLRLPGRPGIDEVVQSHLREAGIDVRIEPSANPLETLRRGEFDLALLSRPTTPGGKAGETPQFATGGGFNYGKYSNPEVDRLITQANSELDEARRRSLHYRIDEILWDDMATVPLQQALAVLVHRDPVVNMVPSSGGGVFVNAHKWGLKSAR